MSGLRRLKETSAGERARRLLVRAGDMSRLPSWPGGRPRLALPAPAEAGAPVPAVPSAELERRRRDVARRLAEQHWDLGGLTYEMAVRDHFRLDVLQIQAARLQELDAELSQLERLAKLEATGAAGACPGCSLLYARGAAFCSGCGTQLIATVTSR